MHSRPFDFAQGPEPVEQVAPPGSQGHYRACNCRSGTPPYIGTSERVEIFLDKTEVLPYQWKAVPRRNAAPQTLWWKKARRSVPVVMATYGVKNRLR